MKKGLGKGLGALLEDNIEDSGIRNIKINEIEPNTDQPRKNFDDLKLRQLSDSIKEHGIVQPIIVRKENEIYRIIAGERRWRAARLAGLDHIPAIVKDISNRQVMEIALIENIQREDLNTIEEAQAYEKLIREYEMTQEDLSKIIGKSRPAITNSIRLLTLPEKVQNYIISGELTSGHGRALITVEDKDIQFKLVEEIIKNDLSVRQTEALVKNINTETPEKKEKSKDENIIEIEEKLKNVFGTKVHLISGKKKGRIMIEYYSNDELDRILDLVNTIDPKNSKL